MKGGLGGKIMKEDAGLNAKTYSHLKDSNNKHKKKLCYKKKTWIWISWNILEAAQIENEIDV